jgi:phage terminase large subunit-like protein
VRGVAYDRYRFEDLQHILYEEGIRVPLVSWGQGYRDMSPAIDAFELAMLERRLLHASHPILNWNASNARADSDPIGNRRLIKQKAIERIDGIVALIMAIGLWSRAAPNRDDRVFSDDILERMCA